jgi:hypothetical protein
MEQGAHSGNLPGRVLRNALVSASQ